MRGLVDGDVSGRSATSTKSMSRRNGITSGISQASGIRHVTPTHLTSGIHRKTCMHLRAGMSLISGSHQSGWSGGRKKGTNPSRSGTTGWGWTRGMRLKQSGGRTPSPKAGQAQLRDKTC